MSQASASTATDRLLIIDDDEMVGKTLGAIAGRQGFKVDFTCDPERFFQQIKDWRPSILAIDLVMPEVDGVQVLRRLAELEIQIPIIITSGVSSRILQSALRSVREHGLPLLGTLRKPFTRHDVKSLLDQRRGFDATDPEQARQFAIEQSEALDASMLKRALDDNQLVVHYQPKIFCADRRLAGFEALVRWAHPERGLIPPDDLIPLADRTGLINPLTTRVVDLSLRWFASLNQSGHTAHPLTMSLNLSARSLGDRQFSEKLKGKCDDYGIAFEQICLELTETSAMEEPTESLDLLTRLRLAGFKLSIDDFGTGYSSMLQLVRLPFSEIKIDKSFVQTIEESEESQKVVRSIIELGRSLGLDTTAEGVETPWALEFLKSHGCLLAQGYLIGPPVDGDQIRKRWEL